jgi:5-methylthioadenosine/S-adenosylhomocysteine deaminase
MTLFRGLADDLPLDDWLQYHIWPAEAHFLSSEHVRWGTRLALAELLRSGVTTVADMYFFEDDVAEEVKAAGMRGVLAQGILDTTTPQGLDVDANLAYAEALIEKWNGDDLITPALGPHAPYTVSPELYTRVHALAERHDVLVHTHLAETKTEESQILAKYGVRPVAYLDRAGVLDRRLLAAHCVWLNDDEIALLAERGVGVAHNPRSNLKLASGVAPAPDLVKAGIAVGLGTDGSASNDQLNLFAEIESAALIHKGVRLDPLTMPAQTVMAMATIEGARALHLDHLIGSIEPGKRADLVVIGLEEDNLTPLYSPISHLAYAVHGDDVRAVMIDGRWIVQDRRILTFDDAEARRQVRRIAAEIAGWKPS